MHTTPGRTHTSTLLPRSPLFVRSLCLLLISTLIMLCTIPATAASKQHGRLVEKRYALAQARYHILQFSREKSSNRTNWLQCAKAFSAAYKTDPYHKLAPDSLLTLGHLHFLIYKRFGTMDDLNEALSYYDDIVSLFPKHSYADDALYKTAQIYAVELKDLKNATLVFARLLAVYPAGDMVRQAALGLKDLKKEVIPPEQISAQPKPVSAVAGDPGASSAKPANPPSPEKTQQESKDFAQVIKVRHWSTESYTRVVIETSKPIAYEGHLLKQDGDKPRRLYVNLDNTHIARELQKTIPIKDGLLQRVRSAQFAMETARVVLDTETLSDYKIFNLDDPFRIVIDVKGTEKIEPAPPTKVVNIPNAPSLAQQLGLGIKRVILDPGHGGKDPGAIGVQGLREKDVVLLVAKKVARKISKELGIETILTRKHDVFLPLEERTAIANTSNGDLFISIHANAADAAQANGVETYYLDLAVTEDEMKIAAKENATSRRQISDLQKMLSSLMNNSKKDESAKLADFVQNNLVSGLTLQYAGIRDHGVKKAPFVVLIGAQMPSILTEIAFLTNPTEATRLRNDTYLEAIADHITNGVVKYAMVLQMAGL